MIDETPTQFSSLALILRREIARIALEALLRDGRIHPSSIEVEVVKAEEEMHANIIDLGEGALRKLRHTMFTRGSGTFRQATLQAIKQPKHFSALG